MNHAVAKVLAEALEPLYTIKLVSVLAGLVKTAVTETKDKKPKKFPIPFSSDSQPLQITNDSLIPDSSKRAIIYFEGNDTQMTDFTDKRSRMTSNLRLICWYNADQYETKRGSVHTALLSYVLGQIPKAKQLADDIYITKIDIGKIHDSTAKLFSQYTYKEERGQFMQPPYYAFGIDITVEFQLNHFCHDIIIPIDTASC